jgi:hypothetical protein
MDAMRKLLLLFVVVPGAIFAQTESEFNIQLSGFFRGDYWYESRQNFGACEELFTLYPKPVKLDSKGKDINAEPVSNMVAIASRLGATVSGPEILGAKSKAYFEADFTSNIGTDGFRFRHAFLQLNWENSSVLFGRFWHPFFVTDAFPTVIALNTGAPFQTFNRSPQLRYSAKLGGFRIVSALVYQGDYASYGPDGASADYMKNSSLPEFNLRLDYLFNDHLIGIAGNYKVIKPRIETENLAGETTTTDELANGSALMGYLKLNFNKLTLKSRAMLGQNVPEYLLMGGYAVSSYDAASGEEHYTPYQHLFTWGNITYGEKVRIGFFGGYAKNLGTMDQIYSGVHPDNEQGEMNTIYARGANIEYSYRLAPHIRYSINNLQFSTELEYTVAAYGEIDYESGKVENSEEVENIRLLLTTAYVF